MPEKIIAMNKKGTDKTKNNNFKQIVNKNVTKNNIKAISKLTNQFLINNCQPNLIDSKKLLPLITTKHIAYLNIKDNIIAMGTKNKKEIRKNKVGAEKPSLTAPVTANKPMKKKIP